MCVSSASNSADFYSPALHFPKMFLILPKHFSGKSPGLPYRRSTAILLAIAGVAELVDALDLGSSELACAGSSPVPGTISPYYDSGT